MGKIYYLLANVSWYLKIIVNISISSDYWEQIDSFQNLLNERILEESKQWCKLIG